MYNVLRTMSSTASWMLLVGVIGALGVWVSHGFHDPHTYVDPVTHIRVKLGDDNYTRAVYCSRKSVDSPYCRGIPGATP